HAKMLSRLALFVQVLKTVPERGDAVFCYKVHEGCQWSLTEFGSTAQGNLVLSVKFKRQQLGSFLGDVRFFYVGSLKKRGRQWYIYGFHIQNLPYSGSFVI